MTPKELEKEARSIAYRRRLGNGLEGREYSVVQYMQEHDLSVLVAGRYRFELTDGELEVKEVPKVSKGQLPLFTERELYE